jgi:hypothetical protein
VDLALVLQLMRLRRHEPVAAAALEPQVAALEWLAAVEEQITRCRQPLAAQTLVAVAAVQPMFPGNLQVLTSHALAVPAL